jgi:hypothetical protein
MVISYSKWSTYQQCPRKFKLGYVDKIPVDFSSPAAVRGTEIHESIEDLLLEKREDLHPDIEFYTQFFQDIRPLGPIPEQAFCFDKDWEATDWDNPEAITRGFLDTHIPMEHTVLEYKTGKEYKEHIHQRHLYGLAGLLLNPKAEEYSVINVYLDQRKNVESTYQRSGIAAYKAKWEKDFAEINTDTIFAPNPSFKCRWCQHERAKGGVCPL